MKKSPSEDLFWLIQSMNKGEKRTFKLMAGMVNNEKDKKYIELFDAIERQGNYNEAKLTKSFKDSYGGQLSVGKNYLYKLILKSLVYFQSGAKGDLATLHEQVRILFDKELYAQARKLLKKGLQIAEEQEDFQTHYSLLSIEGKMLMMLQSERNLVRKIEENDRLRRQLVAKLDNLETLKSLANQLILLRKAYRLGGREAEAARFRALAKSDLLTEGIEPLSKQANVELLNIRRIIASFENDFEKASSYCRQIIAFCDEHPPILDAVSVTYHASVSNLCLYLFKLGHYEEGFEQLERFKQPFGEPERVATKYLETYYSLLIANFIQLGRASKILGIMPAIERDLKLLESKPQPGQGLWLMFWIAYAMFSNGDSTDAGRWLNRLMGYSMEEMQMDLWSNCKMLYVMVQLDKGNFSLAESELMAIRRGLEKFGRYTHFEKQFVKTARAIARAVDGPDYDQTLKIWLKRWQELERGKEGGIWLLDPEAWLNQKVCGQAMADYQRGKLVGKGMRLPF